MDIGPIRIVAIDEGYRRFPCACHVEPSAWVIAAVRLVSTGTAYVTIPIPTPADPVAVRQLFVNGLASLEHFMQTNP